MNIAFRAERRLPSIMKVTCLAICMPPRNSPSIFLIFLVSYFLKFVEDQAHLETVLFAVGIEGVDNLCYVSVNGFIPEPDGDFRTFGNGINGYAQLQVLEETRPSGSACRFYLRTVFPARFEYATVKFGGYII